MMENREMSRVKRQEPFRVTRYRFEEKEITKGWNKGMAEGWNIGIQKQKTHRLGERVGFCMEELFVVQI